MISRRRFLRHTIVSASTLWLARFVYADDAVTIPNFPFYSQESWDAPNGFDCGESCWRMMLLYRANALGIGPANVLSVDDISRIWGKLLGEVSWMDAHQYPQMADLGFTGEYSETATNDWYRAQIDAGCPCVALVSYGGFAPPNHAAEYSTGHYVVVVGFDADGFVIHDPAFGNATDGAYRHISAAEWWAASYGVGIAISGFVSSIYDI